MGYFFLSKKIILGNLHQITFVNFFYHIMSADILSGSTYKIDLAEDKTVYWLFTLGTVYSCSILCFEIDFLYASLC